MRSPAPGFPSSPLGTGLLLCAGILAASLLRMHGGYRPRLPLEHANVAYSLATGAGYSNPFGVSSGPTAWIPPGIPILYAGAIRVAHALRIDESRPIGALNCLASVAAVFLALRFCLPGWRPWSRTAFCLAFLGYGNAVSASCGLRRIVPVPLPKRAKTGRRVIGRRSHQ